MSSKQPHPLVLEYDELRKASDNRNPAPLVFRVYTAKSISPLHPSPSPGKQDAQDDMSGFFAPSPTMQISKQQYFEQFGHLRKGGWARKKNLGSSMVAHILNRPHNQLGRTGNQMQYNLSPWISATTNLDYAIWDISNRLARGEEVVKLAVLRQSKSADAGGWEWTLHGKARSIRGAEVWSVATGEMSEERKNATYIDKMHWDRAHRRALARGEVLYYGRILGESVVADLTFTRQNLPFALPGHLLRPDLASHSLGPLRGWLSITRWDAPYTDWAQAKRRIECRVMGSMGICPAIFLSAQVPASDPPPSYEAALISPAKQGASAQPTGQNHGTAQVGEQHSDLEGILWPVEQPSAAKPASENVQAVHSLREGMSSDIIDLAWSAFEMRPGRLASSSSSKSLGTHDVIRPAD